MQQDLQLRAAAREIYDVWHADLAEVVIDFDAAEKYRTEPYHRAVDAARRARTEISSHVEQTALL